MAQKSEATLRREELAQALVVGVESVVREIKKVQVTPEDVSLLLALRDAYDLDNSPMALYVARRLDGIIGKMVEVG